MSLLGFIMGLGKSREQKMTIWILEHTQKHIAKMIMNSNEFFNACKRHPDRKHEIDDWTGAAFISYFFTCLIPEIGERWEDIYLEFAIRTSANMRNLIQDCIKSISPSLEDRDIEDASKYGYAKWLYDKMTSQSVISLVSMVTGGAKELQNSFATECLTVRAETIPFKEKFL